MYMSEPTLPVAIKGFSQTSVVAALGVTGDIASRMEVQILLSGCLVFLIPMIIFYIFIQRKFVASIATSGIVG
jgi:ABC-type glycerol-3-phosphate transport system permease component